MFLLLSLPPAPVTPFLFLQQHPHFHPITFYYMCLMPSACRSPAVSSISPAQHFRCPKQTVPQWIHSSMFPGLSTAFHTQQSSCAPCMTKPKTQSCFQLPDLHRCQGKQSINELHFLFKPKILQVGRNFH